MQTRQTEQGEPHSQSAVVAVERLAGLVGRVVLAAAVVWQVAMLAGCASSPSSASGPAGALASGGAAKVYAVQQPSTGSQNIVIFSATTSGIQTPSVLTTPSGMQVDSIAVDSVGNIYVGGVLTSGAGVVVYAAGATGSATPTRTILFSGSLYSVPPTSMAVDASGVLYVASDYGVVGIFSATASGTTAPTRVLSSTLLSEPLGIAVDGSGNVYVSNGTSNGTSVSGAIYVFAPGASGAAAPTRTISSSSMLFYGLSTDASGNLYSVADTEAISGTTILTTAQIVVFGPTATGTATPTRTISGSMTGLTFGGGVKVDSVGNVYVVNQTITGTTTNAIATFDLLGFGPMASGNVIPGITVSSSAWNSAGSELAVH